ncbi:uncharacterized protein LOC142175124 [Nicotiana tabacum]|uniref:Uncharacterized protein LOC142175124 n=1 Tax=Nicotiana tabacum TaxID=4097 RepID=A0AC58TKP1_TOBAC
MEFIRLAKHVPHMVKTEKAKIDRFVGSLAYHIKDMTSAAAVGMTTFSSVVGFAKRLEKDRQQRREEKEHNKKARTAGRFNGTSSGGGRDSSNKESLAPAQFSHQSGGGSFFRCQCKLGFHGCYHCGDIGHIKGNCPKLRRNFSGGSTRPSSSSATIVAPPQARGSHNQSKHGQAESAEASVEVITGILLVFSHNAYAIMDQGLTFSYVTPYFAINLGLEPEQLSEPFLVSTPVGKSVRVTRVYRGCIVSIQGRSTEADLIELEMVDFDVIMSMDWLSSYYAMLDYRAKIAQRIITKGYLAYLAHIINPESEPPALQFMLVVREFLEVFPDDLSGLPPERIIDFGIDLMSGTQPIFIPPYRMAPVELNKWREQLKDLLDKGLLGRVFHHGSMAFLGHVVSSEGIKVDPQKTEVVKNWPRPITPAEIRSFLGLTATIEAAYALAQSSFVEHVKAKQDEYPYLVKLKEGVRNKEITAFTLGGDGVLKLNDWLCVPDVDGLRKAIIEEAHNSRYSIHPGATKMYLDLKRLYWWKVMKKQASIGMTPYKALYRRRCRSPVGWFEPAEVPLIGPEFVCEALEKVQLIRERLKASQSRQKSYSDKRYRDLEFMVGDKGWTHHYCIFCYRSVERWANVEGALIEGYMAEVYVFLVLQFWE